jgi:Ca2+-binding EF-hand superfamily protein
MAGGGSANEENAAAETHVWGMKTAQNEIATAMFLMIDTDGDGKISHEELLLHCLEVGMEPNEISVLFSKLDVDGDALVTVEVEPPDHSQHTLRQP